MSGNTHIQNNWGLWLQIAIGIAFMLLPLSYIQDDEELTLTSYLLRVSHPIALLTVFYLNYLWLVPMLLNGKKTFYIVLNLLVIIIFAFGIHDCMSYLWQLRQNQPGAEYHWVLKLSVLLRNIFFLIVAAGLAAAVILSKRWVISEKQRVEMEKAQREAELTNLRQQVNPHFLLNTLNNIYALTSFDQNKAQESIMELSRLLRHILYEGEQERVSLLDEVNFIHNYVNLMRLRLPTNVKVIEEINVPQTHSIQVAPAIFISLIENAFKHGINPLAECFIRITITAEEGHIVCHIENSNHPKSQADQSGHGIGLLQVGRRLELIYPGQYTWEKNIDQNKNIYSSKITIYDTTLHHHR